MLSNHKNLRKSVTTAKLLFHSHKVKLYDKIMTHKPFKNLLKVK